MNPVQTLNFTFIPLLWFLLFVVSFQELGNFVLVRLITFQITGNSYMITKPVSNAAPSNGTVKTS